MTIINTELVIDRVELRDYVWAYEDLMMAQRGSTTHFVDTPLETFYRYVKLNEKFHLNLIGATMLKDIKSIVDELMNEREAAARRAFG